MTSPRMSARRRTLVLGPLLAALLLALTACGSSASDKPAPQRLAHAKAKLDNAKGVTIALKTDRLPQTVSGILAAEGSGTKAPAFKGTITVVRSGISVQVPVIAVGGKVYVKLGGWNAIDPAQYGAPDPAQLFARNGLSQLLSHLTHVKAGQDERQGSAVMSTITAQLPGSQVSSIIPSAQASKAFNVRFLLDQNDTLSSAVVAGPFYPNAPYVTYTINFSNYGTAPHISAP